MLPIGTRVKDTCGLPELIGVVVGEWKGLTEVRCDKPFKNSCGQEITGWVASERQLVVLGGG